MFCLLLQRYLKDLLKNNFTLLLVNIFHRIFADKKGYSTQTALISFFEKWKKILTKKGSLVPS